MDAQVRPATADAALPRMNAPAHAVPLTAAQQGQWFGQQLDPANPIYNAAHLTHIRGALDVTAFARAIEQTLAEADALALAFVVDADGTPRQYLDAARRPRLERLAFSGADAEQQARAWMAADLQTAVDPLRQPLARQVLIRLDDESGHLWYQRVHHLAADGYAMALIEHRAVALYHAYADGQPGTGQPLTSFRAVVAEDAAYQASAARRKDAAWWRQQFEGVEAIESLADASAQTAHGIVRASGRLPEATLALLRQRQRAAGCNWPEVLITLIAAYIQRHVSQQRVVVGVPSMGRLGSAGARSVAFVMNITPLLLDVDQELPLNELIARCARQLVRGRRHGRYRSEQIRRDLALPGGQGRVHGPLINILPFDAAYARSQLDARQEVLRAGPVEDFNFNLRAAGDGSDMRVELEANPRLYTQDEVQAHLARLLAFLPAALQADTLRPVQTLSGAEFEQQVHGVNQSAHPVPDTTLVALVTQTCARHPQNEALRMAGRSISYGEFGTLIERAACRLHAAGVRHGDIVAVALPRSPEMVIALHAIQRAGAAWLPLDVEQPAERAQRILAVAQCSALICDARTRSRTGGHANALDVAALLADDGRATDASTLPPVRPTDPAYVLFTSGSTGEPKGVIVGHRAIVNRLLWMKAHYGLGPGHCFLQKTAYTFDVSVWELFLPMLCAAPLVVAAPGVHRDPHALAALIRAEGVDVVHFVPSMLAAFLEDEASAGLALEQVFCSGEALPAHLRDAFHARLDAQLHNLYGPAEAAVDVSWWPASRGDRSDPVPIGFPTWNTQLLILDAQLRPVPPGVTGQLYLAGVQLADGYLGRPDLTAAAFVPNPYAEQASARMYKSGDLARRRADGAVVYMGRSDQQIKLRGQRVELGEVEAALASHPHCGQVAVLPRPDARGELYLVAYVVPASHADAPEALEQALISHAGQKLPPYMVPAAVVLLPELPVGTSGKLDARALPAPQFVSHATRAARTAAEKQVASAFAQVLGMADAPGADDDFFNLGGHSLLAARLAAELRARTGTELTLGAVFEHPTVERLAAWLEHLRVHAEAGADAGFGPLFTLREGKSGATTPALFCIHPAGGLAWCYGALARQLPGPRAIVGLQSPALDGCDPAYPTLDALAAHFADQVQALQPAGPYHLLGWSVGGIIAQALACELRRREQAVGVVCLLDAYPSEAWRERAPVEAANPYRAILHIAGHDPDDAKVTLDHDGVVGFLRAKGHPLGELSDAQLRGILHAVAYNNRLVREHQHQRYDGPLLFARAALDHQGDALTPAMWQPWAQGLQVVDVPSLHAHLTGEAALAHWLPALQAALTHPHPGHPATPPAR